MKEHTACVGFFDDMRNLETSLSTLQSDIRNLQVDLGNYNYFSSHFLGHACEKNGLNNLPNDKILALTKFKASADGKIIVIQKLKFVLERVENIVEKGENAG